MLSIKDLVFKERLVKKLTKQHVSSEVMFMNIVKLRLPTLMRISPNCKC